MESEIELQSCSCCKALYRSVIEGADKDFMRIIKVLKQRYDTKQPLNQSNIINFPKGKKEI